MFIAKQCFILVQINIKYCEDVIILGGRMLREHTSSLLKDNHDTHRKELTPPPPPDTPTTPSFRITKAS